ncbi:MAG TPA: hypothetical protein VHL52_15415 [Acidimicrobiia bacterium]|nr:hypothetical protein [Acidimicrobiia bacterium]
MSRYRFDSLSALLRHIFGDLVEISSASFAYPELSGNERARVARAVADAAGRSGAFVLSTCLRVEVAVAGDEVALKEWLEEVVGSAGVASRVRQGQQAVEHLFRVAAGLESPILGEVEVLAQFRQATAAMRSVGSVDGWFTKLMESAVAAGRAARDLMPSSPHDTMAALAAQMVGGARQVAVVGSGTMARSVIEALAALPAPPELTVVARRPEAVSIGNTRVLPIEELGAVLARFPVVVSATGASTRLFSADRLSAALEGRSSSLLLVDMAMPPDFDAPEGVDVSYVGIDDLARLARSHRAAEGAEEMVAASAAEAHHVFVNQGRSGPLIAALLASGDAVVEETVARFAGRLTADADRDVLRQAAHTVARTLLNRPVQALRSTRDPDLVQAIAAAFDDG